MLISLKDLFGEFGGPQEGLISGLDPHFAL